MGSFIGRRFIQMHRELVDIAIFSGTGGDPGIARYAGKAVAYLSGKTKGFDQPNEFLDSLVFAASIKESISLKQNSIGYRKIEMWSNHM